MSFVMARIDLELSGPGSFKQKILDNHVQKDRSGALWPWQSCTTIPAHWRTHQPNNIVSMPWILMAWSLWPYNLRYPPSGSLSMALLIFIPHDYKHESIQISGRKYTVSNFYHLDILGPSRRGAFLDLYRFLFLVSIFRQWKCFHRHDSLDCIMPHELLCNSIIMMTSSSSSVIRSGLWLRNANKNDSLDCIMPHGLWCNVIILSTKWFVGCTGGATTFACKSQEWCYAGLVYLCIGLTITDADKRLNHDIVHMSLVFIDLAHDARGG